MEDTTRKIDPEPYYVVGAKENDDRDIHDDRDNHDEDPIVSRKPARFHYATQFYGQLVSAVMLNKHGKPTNYKEAMEGPESEKWQEAMRIEIDSMYTKKL